MMKRVVLAATSALLLATPAHAHVAGCHTTACDRRVHHKRAERWCARTPRCVWRHRWQAQSAAWRSWALATESCESGHKPDAIGGGGLYRGALQFTYGTWSAAGGYGDPAAATIYEQRVRAIRLAQRVGTGQWPVCG
jgi:hypothetical protein